MLSIGTNMNPVHTSPVSRQVDINMPAARQGAGGVKPSVEISLSPDARQMLNIDTQSLAAKGYGAVNIDLDGQPGAEISIDLQSGSTPAMVTVTNYGTTNAQNLAQSLFGRDPTEQDMLALLLEFLAQAQESQPAQPDELQLLLEALQANEAKDQEQDALIEALRQEIRALTPHSPADEESASAEKSSTPA
jgi:hypothetical protein